MEDIYDSEVWKNLDKNALFRSKFEEIIRKSLFYSDKKDINMKIVGDKLVLSYHSRLMSREIHCQYNSDTKYEIFIDDDNNLVINKLSGALRSNYGYDFDNNNGGILDTDYSCEVYDEEGIELAFQGYSDSYEINRSSFDAYKNGFLPAIESAYNPNLVSFANSTGSFLHANILGDSGRFMRLIRSKDDLGIVVSSTCEFDKEGRVINPKEEYYFNTFLSNQAALNPEKICFTRNYPFATIDENHIMHFSNIYDIDNFKLTSSNYKEVANERFLKELMDEKTQNGKHVPKDVIEKYDLMIGKLESKNKNRTM